jgi:hypothetical protein
MERGNIHKRKMQLDNCKNCNELMNGNYCSNCGQPAKLKRIDRHYIIHEIVKIFHAERGILYTIKRMLISPGESIKHYITEDRSRYVKPITFVFITSLIYSIVSHLFHIDAKDYYLQQPEIEVPTLNRFINWMIDYHGYTNMISGLFMAFWIKLFFRKSGYNLSEIFVLLCFVFGISSFFFSVMLFFQGLTHLKLIHISSLMMLIYYTWATGQFFDKKKTVSYLKAFLSYVLGIAVFSILLAFTGVFIDIMIK